MDPMLGRRDSVRLRRIASIRRPGDEGLYRPAQQGHEKWRAGIQSSAAAKIELTEIEKPLVQRRRDSSLVESEHEITERGLRNAQRQQDFERAYQRLVAAALSKRANVPGSAIETTPHAEPTSSTAIEEVENTRGAEKLGAAGEVADELETAEIVEPRNEAIESHEPHDCGLDPCTHTSSNSTDTVISEAASNVISDSETVVASSASPISAPHSLPATVVTPWPYVMQSQSSSVPLNLDALAHFPFATHRAHSQHVPTHRRHWYFKHLSSLFILTLSLATLCFMLYVKNINIGSSFEAAAFVLVAGAMMTKVISSCVWERPAPTGLVAEESSNSSLVMRRVPSLGSTGENESSVSFV